MPQCLAAHYCCWMEVRLCTVTFLFGALAPPEAEEARTPSDLRRASSAHLAFMPSSSSSSSSSSTTLAPPSRHESLYITPKSRTATMPSHLTRHVFRRLLANERVVYQGCLRRQAYSSIVRPCTNPGIRQRQHSMSLEGHSQRRSFFNFNMFRKARREAKEADMFPGVEQMMELERMQRMRARLPPPQQIEAAVWKLTWAKDEIKMPLKDTEAQLVLMSLRYLLENNSDYIKSLSYGRLKELARLVTRGGTPTLEAHVEIGKILYDQMDANNREGPLFMIEAYSKLLSFAGRTAQARELLLHHEASLRGPTGREEPGLSAENDDWHADGRSDARESTEASSVNCRLGRVWSYVLRSAASCDNQEELERTLQILEMRKLEHLPPVIAQLLEMALVQDDAHETRRRWRSYWGKHSGYATKDSSGAWLGRSVDNVLRWCVASGNIDLGHEVVRDVMEINPPKPVWDAVFVWAARTGKGVDEIARMIDVMERSNASLDEPSSKRLPDTTTINALVEFAISKSDPYMAERFISFGRDHGIQPDARTYVLQMDYRLSVSDVDGALNAYTNLQAMDLSWNEDVPAVNRLIVALCGSKRHDFDTIMNVAADLSDRRVRFDPTTVSTLSLLHLSRDELHDVVDLLNTHAFHYSSTERAGIRDAMANYCLDPATPTSRAWDAYTIIIRIFDELPRSARTELMTNFFTRARTDMAVHVFNHMRAHSRADTIPTIDTYVTAFTGSARLGDLESLEVIHNQLKLDYNINVNTHLRNALIDAYTKCGRSRRALQFWDDVVASKEGPSYDSIHMALRACEGVPFGDVRAQEIWNRLTRTRVELDGSLWRSYMAALVAEGNVENAVATLERADEEGQLQADAFLLDSLYEAAPGKEKQAEIETWARARYAKQWEELERSGVEVSATGMRTFKIDRSVAP